MSARDGGRDLKPLVECFDRGFPEATMEIPPWLSTHKVPCSSSLTPGYLYEINHSALPLLAPAELHVLRAAQVRIHATQLVHMRSLWFQVLNVEDCRVTIKFPCLDSLRAFFEATAEKEEIKGCRPEMKEQFTMPDDVAAKVLARRISFTEVLQQGHLKDFWLASDRQVKAEIATPEKRNSPPPRWALTKKAHRRSRRERFVNLPLALTTPLPLSVPREMHGRWSNERYRASQFRLYEIMKLKGARPGKLIPRSVLREEARHFIGDTGLLDHLLKHMTDVVLCDNQRFRRRFNTDGVMEYWLEDAGLLEMRKAAGVEDPTWVPPPGWKPGDRVDAFREGMTPGEAARMEELAQGLEAVKSEMKMMAEALPLPPPPAPAPRVEVVDSQARFREAMRCQVECLKANIEELRSAYVQLHVLQQENPTPTAAAAAAFDSRDDLTRRLERLEQDIHWKFESLEMDKQSVQTQLSNLWSAVMALQGTVASLVTTMQMQQDDAWLGFSGGVMA